MSSFKRGGNRFGNRSFGDRDEGVQLFETVCSDCGNSCEVPFRPNGKKPVFCRDCFKKNSSAETKFERDDRFDRRSHSEKSLRPQKDEMNKYKEQLDMMNFKLDMIQKTLSEMAAKSHHEAKSKTEVKASVEGTEPMDSLVTALKATKAKRKKA